MTEVIKHGRKVKQSWEGGHVLIQKGWWGSLSDEVTLSGDLGWGMMVILTFTEA